MPGDATQRERVVAAARSLLANGGIPTADEVAAAAGISRSTYYRVVGGSHQALLREAGHMGEPSARTRLFDAAVAVLDEVGMSGLLMDAVAERAGVSRATLYRLFPGKSELFAALAESRAPLEGLHAVLSAMADDPPDTVLPRLIQMITPRLLANRGVLRAILAEAAVTDADTGPGRAVISRMYALLAQYLTGQMRAGRLRQIEPLAAAQSLIGPLFVYVVLRPDLWKDSFGELPSPEETVAELIQIWLRGMRPDPPITEHSAAADGRAQHAH